MKKGLKKNKGEVEEDDDDDDYTEQDAEAESAMTVEEEEMEALPAPVEASLAQEGNGACMNTNTVFKNVLEALARGTPHEIENAVQQLRQLQQEQRSSVSELINYSKFYMSNFQQQQQEPGTQNDDNDCSPPIFRLTRDVVVKQIKKDLCGDVGMEGETSTRAKIIVGGDDDDDDVEMPSTPLATGAIESPPHDQTEHQQESQRPAFSAEGIAAVAWLVRALEGTLGATTKKRHKQQKQQQEQEVQKQGTEESRGQTANAGTWGNVAEALTECVVTFHDMMYPLLLNGGEAGGSIGS